ncbi:MAG: hypothetical protein M1816_002465 [Peltula sp. TS41687]|nr:MAG: hypothetical protein M1816_002465 [Peltula sp. TS41687]
MASNPPAPGSANPTSPFKRPNPYSDLTSPRSLRQLTLFLAGSGFLALSTVITRRSLTRRYVSSIPAFYQPSHPHNANKVNGAMEALEALNVATVNVVSVAIMMTGGVLWALDVSSLDDLRTRVRGRLGVDPDADAKRADEELEEWVASVLARKERREDERRARGSHEEGKEGVNGDGKRRRREG